VIIGALIVALDQASKLWIMMNFVEGESVQLLPYIYFTYVQNRGAAFGLLTNHQWLFVIIGLIAIFLAWYYRKLIRQQNWLVRWGITLAIAGAVGNLIDRIRLGAVIDFIDLTFFPVFNVADMAIVLGVAFLFVEVLINDRQKSTS